MEYFNSAEALRFSNWELGSEDTCKRWIDSQVLRYGQTGFALYGVVNKETGKMAGQCGLLEQTVDGRPEIEIGYHLIPSAWGNGYATEAASALRNYAFNNHIADSLISIININNIPSQAVAVRNGMKRGARTTFKEMPVYIYRIEREEWERL